MAPTACNLHPPPPIPGALGACFAKRDFSLTQNKTLRASLFGRCQGLKVNENPVNSLGVIKVRSNRDPRLGLKRINNCKFLCIQRLGDGCNCFNAVDRFDVSCIGRHLYLPTRALRHVAVRSDVVRSGSPDAAPPLSEIYLGPKARGAYFYVVTAVAAISLFVLMLVAHPFVMLFDRYRRKAQHVVAQMWATLTISPFFKVEFEGLEHLPGNDAPAVYVSNHQSFLDIYTLLTLGRCFKFISKTSIFIFPIVGWAMFLMGVIPLKRMDSRSQLECLKRCMDLIRGGASVFFFPEGTRSKDGKLGAFKKGAFSVAAKTGVPVVPMTIFGTGNIMPAGSEGLLNSGSVKVVVHPSIRGNDAQELCSQARTVIADALGQPD